MWSQVSSYEPSKRTAPERGNILKNAVEAQADSGFLSGGSEDHSMRGCAAENADLELSESFIRNLCLKHSSINNLETVRAQQPQLRHCSESIIPQTAINRLNVKWSEIDKIEKQEKVYKDPYEYFFTQDSDGDTQLHITIALNHIEASLWLIGIAPHPCLLDIANDELQTPLHLAVLAREARIVRRLVLAGANHKLRTKAGNTPLHLACALGDLDCAKALTEPLTPLERNWIANNIGARAPPNLAQNLELRNYVGKTCLHIAASKGDVDLVNQLILSGASMETQEGLGGKTALHLAVENGCRQVVHYLVQESRSCLNAVTYAGATAYEIAVDVDRQLAEDLLRFGASAELRCSDMDSSSDSSSEDEPDVLSSRRSGFPRLGLDQTAVIA